MLVMFFESGILNTSKANNPNEGKNNMNTLDINKTIKTPTGSEKKFLIEVERGALVHCKTEEGESTDFEVWVHLKCAFSLDSLLVLKTPIRGETLVDDEGFVSYNPAIYRAKALVRKIKEKGVINREFWEAA